MQPLQRAFFLIGAAVVLGTAAQLAYGAGLPSGAVSLARRVQAAVRDKNAKFVSDNISYPIDVYLAGNKFEFPAGDGATESAEDTYSEWMTTYLYSLITKASPEKLVKLLEIRKDKDGIYRVHNLLFSGDPADFRYSDDGIYSAKDLLHVIAMLKKGAKEHCAKCVAKVIEYPIWDCIDGKVTKISNEAEFEKYYDQIVTPEVKELMLHAWDRHNWTGIQDKGIMLGPNGDIWIGSFGHKDAEGFWVWETKVWALREVGSCPPQ